MGHAIADYCFSRSAAGFDRAASTSAQTAFGLVNVWLQARESAEAPNDQQVTLYQKSKALVIGMDHYSSGWPELSNGIKDAEEVQPSA